MRNPFEIGERYRNRKGEYEVIELDEPRMVIRYDDGETIETRVKLQARILTNMQAERAARKRQAIRRAARKSKSSRGRIRFDGLSDNDFQSGTAGTNWRSRTSLGGLLADRLSVRTNREFQSHAVFRQPSALIAQTEHYDKKTSARRAKFAFHLDTDSAHYGFYIEKDEHPMDDSWDWPRLLAFLASDELPKEQLLRSMRRLDLYWEGCGAPGDQQQFRVTATEDGLQWQEEGGEAEAITWEEFAQKLQALPEDSYCNLYLWGRMDQNEAIAAGAGIADTAVEVYGETLPLYDAAVGA